MMDPTAELFLMSIAMFVGCYVAGRLPLILQSRENKNLNQLMSVFGAGMLVGTAFTVIIPEGIRTLYSDCNHTEPLSSPSQSVEDSNPKIEPPHEHNHNHDNNNEVTIALSLLLGFLFMLLVDKFSASHHSSSSRGGGGTDGDTNPNTGGLINGSTSTIIGGSSRKVCTATLGLVVHAAADGIALGAAAASHHSDVEFIVFFAIMLHKAPTAFGLTSFLVREGNDKRRINRMLLVFAAAAPIGAFATYILVIAMGSDSVSSSTYNSSVAMLFSAGTFLYVATVHIIPELTTSSPGGGSGDGDAGGGGAGQLSWKQLLTMIIGAFVPLIFSIGHHH